MMDALLRPRSPLHCSRRHRKIKGIRRISWGRCFQFRFPLSCFSALGFLGNCTLRNWNRFRRSDERVRKFWRFSAAEICETAFRLTDADRGDMGELNFDCFVTRTLARAIFIFLFAELGCVRGQDERIEFSPRLLRAYVWHITRSKWKQVVTETTQKRSIPNRFFTG